MKFMLYINNIIIIIKISKEWEGDGVVQLP